MEWYLKVVRNYVGFTGRARRTEYWMFVLFNVIAGAILSVIDRILDTSNSNGVGAFGSLYSLVLFLPGLAVAIRRLHDTNRSGWFLLLGLIPVVGAIVLIVFLAQEGDRGNNQYGSDPKMEAVPAAV